MADFQDKTELASTWYAGANSVYTIFTFGPGRPGHVFIGKWLRKRKKRPRISALFLHTWARLLSENEEESLPNLLGRSRSYCTERLSAPVFTRVRPARAIFLTGMSQISPASFLSTPCTPLSTVLLSATYSAPSLICCSAFYFLPYLPLYCVPSLICHVPQAEAALMPQIGHAWFKASPAPRGHPNGLITIWQRFAKQHIHTNRRHMSNLLKLLWKSHLLSLPSGWERGLCPEANCCQFPGQSLKRYLLVHEQCEKQGTGASERECIRQQELSDLEGALTKWAVS